MRLGVFVLEGHQWEPNQLKVIAFTFFGTAEQRTLRGPASGPHRWKYFLWASQLGIFGLIFESVLRGGVCEKRLHGPSKSALLCSTFSVLLSPHSC